jgi:hypothetical protein
MRQRKILFFALVLLAASLACNTLLPTQAPASAPPSFPTEDPLPHIQRVSLEDAKAAFDNDEALFLDVRGLASYEQSHIQGALSIPLMDLELRMDELDPKQWIITYCA